MYSLATIFIDFIVTDLFIEFITIKATK